MQKKKNQQYSNFLARLFPLKEGQISARNITIQVTDACNLRCTYCYQINKKTNVIPFQYATKFLDSILNGQYDNYCDYTNAQGIILQFIGGQPFLQVDLIDKITDYFINRLIELNHPWLERFKISICSNGTLYFQQNVQKFIAKHLNHLSFNISIDGNKKLHDSCRIFPDGSGSYDVAIAAVKHYKEHFGRQMGSKMTLAPQNIEYTYQAVVSLIENGYTDINLNCVFEQGWTVQHSKVLYKQLKQLSNYVFEHNLEDTVDISMFSENSFNPMLETQNSNWCGGTGSMLAIDYKGDLYPCIRYMQSSLGDDVKPLIIGNVNTGILVTDEQKQIKSCMDCVTRRSQSTDECFYCDIASGCAWCSGYNYQCFGTVNKRATYICIMHKARALANAYYWNMYHLLKCDNIRFKIYLKDEQSLKIIDKEELQLLHLMENTSVVTGKKENEQNNT